MTVLTVFGTGTTSGPSKIWNKRWGPGLIANLDLDIPVFFGPDQPITELSDQIPPLGVVGVDGTRDLYASSLTSAQVLVQSTPGATSWAPSPAQAALQIASLGLARDTSVQAVNGTLGAPAQDDSVTTALPNTLQAGGIPPYLPGAQSFGYGPVTPGNTQTLFAWGAGTYRVWSSYVTLSAVTNSTFTGVGVFTAYIADQSGNVYASASLRFTGPSQPLSVAVPFDSKGLPVAGPNSLSLTVSAAVTNAVAGATGGVMVSQ